MFARLFLTVWLLAAPDPGAIAGLVTLPDPSAASKRILVVLLPAQYMLMWENDVQMRLDNYWERFKLIQGRNLVEGREQEAFLEVSRTAHAESTQFVMARMLRDPALQPEALVYESTNGEFRFRNVQPGSYKVVAVGNVGARNFVWYDSVEVGDSESVLIQLKTRIP